MGHFSSAEDNTFLNLLITRQPLQPPPRIRMKEILASQTPTVSELPKPLTAGLMSCGSMALQRERPASLILQWGPNPGYGRPTRLSFERSHQWP